jgi:hypothetical protein
MESFWRISPRTPLASEAKRQGNLETELRRLSFIGGQLRQSLDGLAPSYDGEVVPV